MIRTMKTKTKLSLAFKIILCAGVLYAAGMQLPGRTGWTNAQAVAAAAPSGSSPLAGPQASEPVPEPLRRFAADAIQKLAQTEPFTAWASAKTVIEPLGPGTHSWLVSVTAKGAGEPQAEGNPPQASQQRGYLIISATESGEYKLVEYGVGENSVFSRSLLEAALQDSGLTGASRLTAVPLYAGPALAEWMVRLPDSAGPQFIGAADGEWLPETAESWDRQAAGYKAPRQAAGSSQSGYTPGRIVYTSSRFDPYDNLLWMTGKPLALKQDNFVQNLQTSKQLVYAASGPERTYSFPLPVYGYQAWTDSGAGLASQTGSIDPVYAVTGSSSSSAIRLIALDALMDAGKFVSF